VQKSTDSKVRMSQDVWIIAEHKEGEFAEVTFGLLGEGRRLCKRLSGGSLSSLVLGPGMTRCSQGLGHHGADRVYAIEHPSMGDHSPELEATLIADLAREKAPLVILFAATSNGSDLAARVAATLRAPLVTHCVDVRIGAGKRLEFLKAVSDEMLYATLRSEAESVQVATISPDVMQFEDPDVERQAEVVEIHPSLSGPSTRLRTLGVIKGDPKTIPLEEAEIVVAGGRGLGDEESFQLVHELAEALEGSVGGSRPVVDEGRLPFERQIGRTGKTTSPKLFVACGISGASEFTGGMEKSKQLIAINTDRDAPILQAADLGIVGDGRKVIPEIIRLVRERREKQDGP
jgi:electron transfer flavoprotein alpha subunit